MAELIACPEGKEELTVCTMGTKIDGRGRSNPSFKTPFSTRPPVVATSSSIAEYLCWVSVRNSAAMATIMSTVVPVPSAVTSIMTLSSRGEC
jgi:hypothetical protein